MLKILGRYNSLNTQKVLWLCGELDLAYQLDNHGMEHGKNDRPEYLALNPMGLVPTILDGDFVLWESNAILRYLGRKHSRGALYPTDPGQIAMGDRWMDWQLAHLNPAFRPVFRGLTRVKVEDRDMVAIDRARDEMARLVAMLDRCLERTDFLAGPNFSIYDIAIGVQAYRWFKLDIKREPYPAFEAWYERLARRKPFQQHIMIELK